MVTERIVDTNISSDPLLLKGTGWDLQGQMEMISKASSEAFSLSEWKDKTIEKTTSDLKGLYWEYLIKSPVLPFDLGIVKDRVVCTQYGETPLPEIVSSQERNGSIKRSMEKLEEELLAASNGQTFVLISPPGWSGYDGIKYPDTQIYYYQKKGTEIRSLTLLCPQADLDRCEDLYSILKNTKINETSSECERILNLTSNLISLNKTEPEEIVSSIENILGRNLPDMRDCLNALPAIDHKVQQCINDLETFIRDEVIDASEASQRKLMYQIGQTVLDMKSVLIRGRKPESKEEYVQSYVAFTQDEGCNGGGTIYSRGKEEQEEEEFPNWGICAMKDGCIGDKGHEQQLGLCMICKSCDRAFRSGKSESEIRAMSSTNKPGIKENKVNSEVSFFTIAALLFARAIFDN